MTTLADRTQCAVEARLGALHDEYGGFDVLGETVDLSSDRYERERRAASDGTICGVAVWVVDDGRLLLTRTEGAPAVWRLPGGPTDGDESLQDAATRHVREWTGVECDLTNVVEVRRTRLRDGDRPPIHTCLVYFAARAVGGDPSPRGPLVDAAWHESPPDVVDTAIEDRLRGFADDPAGFAAIE